MSNYQFAGSLYRTESDMLDAIAHAWVTSNGNATFDDVVSILRNASDDDLTANAISERDPDTSHMARHGYEPTDLKQAFAASAPTSTTTSTSRRAAMGRCTSRDLSVRRARQACSASDCSAAYGTDTAAWR